MIKVTNSKTIKVLVDYGMKDDNDIINFNDDTVYEFAIRAAKEKVKNFNDDMRYQFQTTATIEFKQDQLFDLLYTIGIEDPCADLRWDMVGPCWTDLLSTNLELRKYLLKRGLKLCKESGYGILSDDEIISEEEMDQMVSYNGDEFLDYCTRRYSDCDMDAIANLTGVTDAIANVQMAAYSLKTNKDNKVIDILTIREGDDDGDLDELFYDDDEVKLTRHHIILNDENVECYCTYDMYERDANTYCKMPEYSSEFAYFKPELGGMTCDHGEYEMEDMDYNLIEDLCEICEDPYAIELNPKNYTDAIELCNTIIDKMLDSESYNILEFPPIGPREDCDIKIQKSMYGKIVVVKEISIVNEKKSAELKIYPTYYKYTLKGKLFDHKTYSDGGYAMLNELIEVLKDYDVCTPWQEVLENMEF